MRTLRGARKAWRCCAALRAAGSNPSSAPFATSASVEPLALARGVTRGLEPLRQIAQLRAKHMRLAFALCGYERLLDLVALPARGLRVALLFGKAPGQLGELRRLAGRGLLEL